MAIWHVQKLYTSDGCSYKLQSTFKSLSNISYLVLSKDEKQIAVVNTSGTIAIHMAETGELLGKVK